MKNESYIIYGANEIDSLVVLVDEAIKALNKKATDETEAELKARFKAFDDERKDFWFKFKKLFTTDIKNYFKKEKTEYETYEEYKNRLWKRIFRCNVGSTLSYLEFLNQMVLNAKKNNCGFELSYGDHKILVKLLDEKDLYIYSLNKSY